MRKRPTAFRKPDRVGVVRREAPDPGCRTRKPAGMLAEKDLGADHQRRRVDWLTHLGWLERVAHPPERQRLHHRGEVEARVGEPIPDLATPAGWLTRHQS